MLDQEVACLLALAVPGLHLQTPPQCSPSSFSASYLSPQIIKETHNHHTRQYHTNNFTNKQATIREVLQSNNKLTGG